MKEYIDKAVVKAWIKEKKIPFKKDIDGGVYPTYLCALMDFEDFLDTLEVKEVKNFIWNNARTTVPEDSTNQIICIKEDGLAVSTIGKIVNGTVKWAYLDDLLNTNSFNVEVKEVDLDREIRRYRMSNPIIQHREESLYDYMANVAKHFFELGLKAKGEQGMIKIRGYVARDNDDSLWFHYAKPHRENDIEKTWWGSNDKAFQINDFDFPEYADLTWEESEPVEVELTLTRVNVGGLSK